MTRRIPDMTGKRLKKLVAQIKPVGRTKNGILCFYAPCDPRENFSFYGDLCEPAQELKELERIETFHYVGSTMGVDRFMPTAEEVYAQIPEVLLPRVVAFETLVPNFEDGTVEQAAHLKEDDYHYHRTTTILYEK